MVLGGGERGCVRRDVKVTVGQEKALQHTPGQAQIDKPRHACRMCARVCCWLAGGGGLCHDWLCHSISGASLQPSGIGDSRYQHASSWLDFPSSSADSHCCCSCCHCCCCCCSVPDLECPICLDAFDSPVMTSCSHWYCKECILGVLSSSTHCPLCRGPVVAADLRAPGKKPEPGGFVGG